MIDRRRSTAIQRAIITGANGFIGSTLVATLLESGTEVHTLVNEKHNKLERLLAPEFIHVLKGDAQKAVDIIFQVKPDVIFHLAAVYAEPDDAQGVLNMIQGNLTLGTCLLYGCTHLEVPPVFVNTGTYWQYDETGTYEPNTLYASTKQAFQDMLAFYHRRLGVRSVTLALYDTFGENDDRDKLWQRLARSSPGTHIPLSMGVQEIFLTHIKDTTDAFVLAAHLLKSQYPLKELYGVRPKEPFVLRPFVEELNEEAGAGLSLGWGELPFWGGQVIRPWRGELLPGWYPKHESKLALLAMLKRKNAKVPA